MSSYDVIIIGAGPGGYVCAIRCAQLGLRTAVVEGRTTLGGTCLNIGCIPSKALLHATHNLHEAGQNFAKMGLKGSVPSVDWRQMLAYKDEVIDQNTAGIEYLFRKNKIEWLKGWGSIPRAGMVKVGNEVHDARNIVIASGSVPSKLAGVEIDNARGIVVDSEGALSLPRIPEEMAVIGAGVIGLELGSVFARLGSKVTVLEFLDAITPGMDADVQRDLQRTLTSQGLTFVLGAAVESVDAAGDRASLTYRLRKDGSVNRLETGTVLVATGREPFVDGLGLSGLGVEMTEPGQIRTDSRLATSVDGIYAIGDAVAGPMLAHKAEDEGVAVAEIIAGNRGHVNYDLIPSVIYTTPEVAAVGKTEQQLKTEGRAYQIGKFSFMGNGRAKAIFQGQGFVKMLADKDTGRIVGCHIVGPSAGDVIHEICVGMEFGASAADLARTCHAHPTFSEAVREAALACSSRAIHA